MIALNAFIRLPLVGCHVAVRSVVTWWLSGCGVVLLSTRMRVWLQPRYLFARWRWKWKSLCVRYFGAWEKCLGNLNLSVALHHGVPYSPGLALMHKVPIWFKWNWEFSTGTLGVGIKSAQAGAQWPHRHWTPSSLVSGLSGLDKCIRGAWNLQFWTFFKEFPLSAAAANAK